MCKLKGHGKRCPETPQRKQMESYRQKVKYRATKEGLSSGQWLTTKDGQEFNQLNNPKIINTNWEQEHQANLALLREQNHPQVTMKNDFATPHDLSILKANFPAHGETRGTDKLATMDMTDYLKHVSHNSRQISEDEGDSLDYYTSNGYKRMTNILRNAKEGMSLDEYNKKIFPSAYTPEELRKADAGLREQISHIDNVLSERRSKQEITYRAKCGKGTMQDGIEMYKTGGVLKFDSFSSTSHTPSMSMNFSDHVVSSEDNTKYEVDEYAKSEYSVMFEVQTNAGMAIAHHSSISVEREVLLPRGIHFKIVGTHVPTPEDPYKIKNPLSVNSNSKLYDLETAVESKFIVVQLVECDKDGNILPPDHKEPFKAPPLPPRPAELDN